MRNLHLHFNILILILLIAALVIFILVERVLPRQAEDGVTLLTALIALVGCFSVANFSHRADQRAKATNSFELGRRWDAEPILGTREIVRGKSADELVAAVRNDNKDVKKALVHLVNFFWELSAAMETGWTHESYLRQKFRPSLKHYYPAIDTYLSDPRIPGRTEAMKAIDLLDKRWSE